MNEWMNEWVNEWINDWMKTYASMNKWITYIAQLQFCFTFKNYSCYQLFCVLIPPTVFL